MSESGVGTGRETNMECPDCGGFGKFAHPVDVEPICKRCNGSGRLLVTWDGKKERPAPKRRER